MRINFIIETSQEYFCSWLEDFTQDTPNKYFQTEKGHISLQTARPAQYGYRGNRYMNMEGFYLTPTKEGSLTAYPMSNIIQFKIIPLNQNQIEIMAECTQPSIEDYFQFLLGEIHKRWSSIKSAERQISELQETIIGDGLRLGQMLRLRQKIRAVFSWWLRGFA